MDTDIDQILDRLDREAARQVQDLKARGVDPAPVHDQVSAGLHLFGFTLRWPDPAGVTAEIRLGMSPKGSNWKTVWGEGWPGHGASLSGTDLLAFLVDQWPSLAQGYLDGPAPAASQTKVSFADGVSRPDLPRLDVIRDGDGLTVSTDAGSRSYGVESVIIVEVLGALGDVLAGHLAGIGQRPDLVTAWKAMQDMTALPPMPVEGDGPGARNTVDAEADWYAGQFGISPEGYRLSAIDVHARQILFAAGRIPNEPASSEYAPGRVPENLPSKEEIHARAAEAAPIMGVTPESLMESAVNGWNIEARQIVLYRNKGKRRLPDDEAAPSP